MNFKKKTLFLIGSALIAQSSLFAANARLENKSLSGQEVAVVMTDGTKGSFKLQSGENRDVSTGTKGFSKIIWKALPGYTEAFSADIPSSANLSKGSIILSPNGLCRINFDANSNTGSGQLREIQGNRINN